MIYFGKFFKLLIVYIELSIIKQKSIKLDLELEKAEENAREINREIRNQRKILEQMDMKIHKKQKEQETEEKELEQEHDELIEKLKVSNSYRFTIK